MADHADETVFGLIQRQERERREAIARGEPDPVTQRPDDEEKSEEEKGRLEKFEDWMSTDWEFGPYYWEQPDAEAPGRLKKARHFKAPRLQ